MFEKILFPKKINGIHLQNLHESWFMYNIHILEQTKRITMLQHEFHHQILCMYKASTVTKEIKNSFILPPERTIIDVCLIENGRYKSLYRR